jgi:hypothetical protein
MKHGKQNQHIGIKKRQYEYVGFGAQWISLL